MKTERGRWRRCSTPAGVQTSNAMGLSDLARAEAQPDKDYGVLADAPGRYVLAP